MQKDYDEAQVKTTFHPVFDQEDSKQVVEDVEQKVEDSE